MFLLFKSSIIWSKSVREFQILDYNYNRVFIGNNIGVLIAREAKTF